MAMGVIRTHYLNILIPFDIINERRWRLHFFFSTGGFNVYALKSMRFYMQMSE